MMKISSIAESKGSLQEISFQLSSRHQGPPSDQLISDSEHLSYSHSSISTPKQSRHEIPISIQIDHEPANSHHCPLPKIEPNRKYLTDRVSALWEGFGLSVVLQKARVENRRKGITSNQNYQHKRQGKGESRNRRSLSLQQEHKTHKQRSKAKSKTMLSTSIVAIPRENQENHSPNYRDRKQLRPMCRPRERDNLLSLHGPSPLDRLDDGLGKSCMAKKLYLGQNLDQEKSYLRKITQNRQNTKHLFSKA